MIKAVAATVVVLVTGSAVTMRNWINRVPAIVEAWYAGEEGGSVISDVRFGDYNPGGKLPITFPQRVEQVPLYYNVKPSGRGYDYVNISGKPQFPIGHGLSCTQFKYAICKSCRSRLVPMRTFKSASRCKMSVLVPAMKPCRSSEDIRLRENFEEQAN